MKTYSQVTDEVLLAISRMKSEHHQELDIVTVGALFIFDDEDTEEAVLKHQGYPAAAVVRITPLRDRALGIDDAVIVIDRAYWLTLRGRQCDALIDHELTHLELVLDDESGGPKADALGRPKLAMRKHDRQMGWFDDVARRHGEDSLEIRHARALIAETGQLYFDFALPPKLPPTAGTGRGRQTAH